MATRDSYDDRGSNMDRYLDLFPAAASIFHPQVAHSQTSLPGRTYSPYDVQQPLLDRFTAYNDKHLRNTIAPNFEWANKTVLGTVNRNQFNPKTMPLISGGNQTYGMGIANLGWTPRNIHKQVDLIRANQNVKAGGQEQIFDAMTDWAKSRNWKNKPRKQALLDYFYKPNYLESLDRKSQRNKNWTSPLRMDDILQASDYAIREASRAQQHKSNWLDNTLTAITNPSTWMDATHAYLTGNLQSAQRAFDRAVSDVKGPPTTQSANQYGLVGDYRGWPYSQDESPSNESPYNPAQYIPLFFDIFGQTPRFVPNQDGPALDPAAQNAGPEEQTRQVADFSNALSGLLNPQKPPQAPSPLNVGGPTRRYEWPSPPPAPGFQEYFDYDTNPFAGRIF